MMRLLLLLHAWLMLIAGTQYSLLTHWYRGDELSWNFFQYHSASGFGGSTEPSHSLAVVLAYLAAYSVGIVGFGIASRAGSPILGSIGLILSLVGVISFLIEGSHWVFTHERFWLLHSPTLMIFLSFLVIALTPLPADKATRESGDDTVEA